MPVGDEGGLNVYCCTIDKQLSTSPLLADSLRQPPGSTLRNGPLAITGARKTSGAAAAADGGGGGAGGGGSTYVVYTIRLGQLETRRRYSEFESLRKSLCRLHPALVVPPVPEKHSIADYATMQNRAKDDVFTIEKRKRMLQSFLNRLARHPILCSDHVFHRFLEPSTQWSEVLHTAPLIHLPSNPLTASPGTAANPASGASSTPPLAVPSSSQTLKNPDPRFIECEAFTNRFAAHLSGPFGKSHKRVVRKLSDLANDYAELGALYNVFSLNESGNLASAIEKVGQAVDASYVFSSSVVTALEAEVSEPLQEYEMFAQIIKSVLKYRRLKHVQVEQAAETLAQKRVTLESLEHVENEARRIDELLRGAVGGGGGGLGSQRSAGAAPPTRPDGGSGAAEERTTLEHAPTSPNRELSVPGSAASGRYAYGYGGPGPRSRSPNIRIGSGSKLINALSHRIQGMMDVDPEATRRNNIGKTRDAIALLEEQLGKCGNDLTQISAGLQEELNRFQNVKVADFRDILLAFSNIHHKWCQKNVEVWEEAYAEVEKIEG